MNKSKTTKKKTSRVFWGLILISIGLGLYDFIERQSFRRIPEASDWYGMSWLIAGGAALIFTAIIIWVDRYERESWKWLLLAFMWGALAAPALNHQLRFMLGKSIYQEIITLSVHKELASDIVNTTLRLFVPFTEELSKGLFIFLIFLGIPREFDNLLDGIIYGAMVGIGFAMVEQVGFLQKEVLGAISATADASEAFWDEAYRRVFLTGLWSHPMLSAFVGAGLSWARTTKSRWQRWVAPILGFFLAVLIHKNWNFLADSIIRNASFEQAAIVLISPYALLIIAFIVFAMKKERPA